MEIKAAIKICNSRGIKVYPIHIKNTNKFKIQISERGKLNTFSKEVVQGKEPAIAIYG